MQAYAKDIEANETTYEEIDRRVRAQETEYKRQQTIYEKKRAKHREAKGNLTIQSID